jgi:hypothetical protein
MSNTMLTRRKTRTLLTTRLLPEKTANGTYCPPQMHEKRVHAHASIALVS